MSIIKKYIKTEKIEDLKKEIKTKIIECIEVDKKSCELWGTDKKGNKFMIPPSDMTAESNFYHQENRLRKEIYLLDIIICEFENSDEQNQDVYNYRHYLPQQLRGYQKRYDIPFTKFQIDNRKFF